MGAVKDDVIIRYLKTCGIFEEKSVQHIVEITKKVVVVGEILSGQKN